MMMVLACMSCFIAQTLNEITNSKIQFITCCEMIKDFIIHTSFDMIELLNCVELKFSVPILFL